MMKFVLLFAAIYGIVVCEVPVNGIKPSNILGGAEQHASFSFIRPGLTQTSYAFNGPSSHQSFSSSIGNPHLAQRVLPNVAHALAYRNPGLGYFPTAPISTAYANSPYAHHQNFQINSAPVPQGSVPASAFSYQQQAPLDQATALAYLQQYRQYQHQANNAQPQVLQSPEVTAYQAQLGQYYALRSQQPAELQVQQHAQNHQAHGHTSHRQYVPVHETSEQVQPEQLQLQQQVQQTQNQNLLGVAYSSAPSVAHVKVSGNGYKFDF